MEMIQDQFDKQYELLQQQAEEGVLSDEQIKEVKDQNQKHDLQQRKKKDDASNLEKNAESEAYQNYGNQRLMTPRMKKVVNKKDASSMLKDELKESLLRLKAAKFGHSIEEIAPQYPNSFYLPNKPDYRPAYLKNSPN